MKVILKESVKGLGRAGAVVEVSDGYGRNYLIPRGLAVEASPANLAKLRQQQEREEAAQQRALKEATEAAARLDGAEITVTARAGEGGRLFGSVTAQDVAEAIARQRGVRVDRRRIELPEAIKALGVYQAALRLHPQVTARITIHVIAAR